MMDKQSFEIEGLDFIVSMPVLFITVFIRQHIINYIPLNILVRICFKLEDSEYYDFAVNLA